MVRNGEIPLNGQRFKRTLWWPLVFLLAACLGSGPSATHPAGVAGTATVNISGILSVRDAVHYINQLPANASRQSLVIDAWINQPPSQDSGAIAPPPNCPVIAARLPTLTDQAFATEFSVAGVKLPNAIPNSLPSLELVIPFSLGMIDLPAHADLHGHIIDPAYASCPDSREMFVLDSVTNPTVRATPVATSNDQLTASWQIWSDPIAKLGLNYPDGWTVQATHNVGSVVSAQFTSSDATQRVSLDVTAGETYWTQQSSDSAPAPLQGDRQVLTNAGQALARLVDVVGNEQELGHQRTLRLVFNYSGNTVILTTRFVDGTALDHRILGIFTGMASSFHFDQPLGISDPMDPTLTARSAIGTGPFIGQSTAIGIATASSGLTQTTVISASMVSEKAARETTPGVCREFQERPQAVWLVKLSGTKPTGEKAIKLIYLDAVTGESICQADVDSGS